MMVVGNIFSLRATTSWPLALSSGLERGKTEQRDKAHWPVGHCLYLHQDCNSKRTPGTRPINKVVVHSRAPGLRSLVWGSRGQRPAENHWHIFREHYAVRPVMNKILLLSTNLEITKVCNSLLNFFSFEMALKIPFLVPWGHLQFKKKKSFLFLPSTSV